MILTMEKSSAMGLGVTQKNDTHQAHKIRNSPGRPFSVSMYWVFNSAIVHDFY